MTTNLYTLDQNQMESGQPTPTRRPWLTLIAYLLLIGLVPASMSLGGEAANFGITGLIYLPFVILAGLAYVAGSRSWVKAITVLWLVGLLLGAALVSVVFTLMSQTDLAALESGEFDPAGLTGIGVNSGIALFGLVLSGLALLPAVRRRAARILPLDPNSFVHGVALSAVIGVTVICFGPLLALATPPMLSDNFISGLEMDAQSGLLSTLYTLIWSLPIAILAVGLGIKRSFPQVLARLGLARPSLTRIGVGIGTALALVVFIQALSVGLNALWGAMGWAGTDAEAFSQMLAFAFTPLGAVVIGVSAGLGEEVAIRGVLQPKLGILLSNLFFTSLHAFQYSWDALIVVFLVGAAFGLLRQRMDTTTAAISHGVYNFTLIMMAIYGITLF